MKKSIVYSLLASVSMITTAAYADDPKASVLTTQRYVDDGLEFVYKTFDDAINGHDADLEHGIEASTGLAGDVADLQDTVGDLQDDIGNVNMGTNASTITGAISELNTAIGTAGTGGNAGTGLTGDVEALQDALDDGNNGLIDVGDLKDDVDDVKGALSDGNGGYIDVSDLKQTVDTLDSLDTTGLGDNKTYVLKTNGSGVGSWSELETVNTWNPSFLTNP